MTRCDDEDSSEHCSEHDVGSSGEHHGEPLSKPCSERNREDVADRVPRVRPAEIPKYLNWRNTQRKSVKHSTLTHFRVNDHVSSRKCLGLPEEGRLSPQGGSFRTNASQPASRAKLRSGRRRRAGYGREPVGRRNPALPTPGAVERPPARGVCKCGTSPKAARVGRAAAMSGRNRISPGSESRFSRRSYAASNAPGAKM